MFGGSRNSRCDLGRYTWISYHDRRERDRCELRPRRSGNSFSSGSQLDLSVGMCGNNLLWPFPRKHLHLLIVPVEGQRGVLNRRTLAYGGISTRVLVGQLTTEGDLKRDWIMTHEVVHLAFPSVAEEHHWIEEGIATYVEPIARVEAGNLEPRSVWHDLVEGLPKGLPQAGDEGLDHTHTWGRTYWGGALFCTLADVDIRERTNNRYGLQDALRAILAAVPRSILYDNTKLAVARIMGDGRRLRTRVFSELQSHYLFADRFGRPGKGNAKGKVEGLVGYARRECRKFRVREPYNEARKGRRKVWRRTGKKGSRMRC